jgi:signal transduction histidine kinase
VRGVDGAITSLTSESGEVVVAVRDSGTGLDPRDGDRIFDAFFTMKATGLGLGLSISRTIIEAHGGRLWGVSDDGPGATVCFSLPPGSAHASGVEALSSRWRCGEPRVVLPSRHHAGVGWIIRLINHR